MKADSTLVLEQWTGCLNSQASTYLFSELVLWLTLRVLSGTNRAHYYGLFSPYVTSILSRKSFSVGVQLSQLLSLSSVLFCEYSWLHYLSLNHVFTDSLLILSLFDFLRSMRSWQRWGSSIVLTLAPAHYQAASVNGWPSPSNWSTILQWCSLMSPPGELTFKNYNRPISIQILNDQCTSVWTLGSEKLWKKSVSFRLIKVLIRETLDKANLPVSPVSNVLCYTKSTRSFF